MTRWLLLLIALPVAAAADRALLPADAYPKLLARSAAVMAETLKVDKPTRRAADRVRVVAVLLAEAAQQDLTGPDAAQRRTTRDAALRIAQLVRDQEFAKARQLALDLPQLKPEAAAKKEPVKLLGSHIEMDELMSVFRKTNLGGLDIEAEFDRLASDHGPALPAAELTERLELFAYQTALVGGLLEGYAPDKQAAEWGKLATAMRQSGLALGSAAKAKDGPAAYKALAAGNANCTACHKMFR